MPSRLDGLIKTLSWSDFQGTPNPKKPTLEAFTSATFNLPVISPAQIPGTQNFHFLDNVVVTITMNSGKSWKRSAQPPADLLKHEQGHYDLVALIARDLFIEIMQLKPNIYSKRSDAMADLQAIITKFSGKVESISDIYDSDPQTKHGKNAPQQATWNTMFRRAFTEPRNPLVLAPDRQPYKVPFLDILSQNGINP